MQVPGMPVPGMPYLLKLEVSWPIVAVYRFVCGL